MIHTVSVLIYQAWLRTEKPILYKTKDETKEIRFADPLQNKYFNKDFTGVCNLCGAEIKDGGIDANKFFGSNYMDWTIHKNPESTHICKSCTFCLGMNPVGRIMLLRYPVVVEKTLHLCNREQFRKYVLNPPEPPFVMIFPTSQKKHLFSKAKISYSREKFFCNLEEMTIYVDSSINKLVETIDALRGIGLSLDNIRHDIVSAKIVKKYDFASQEKLINLMQKITISPMFELAVVISQSQKEEDAICYLDLTPKMK